MQYKIPRYNEELKESRFWNQDWKETMPISDSPEQITRRLTIMRLYLLPKTLLSYTEFPSLESLLQSLQNLQYRGKKYVDSLSD